MKSTYLAVPYSILKSRELNTTEKLILSLVISFIKNGDKCYASNNFLADLFNTSERTISKTIRSLIEKGFLKADFSESRNRLISLNRELLIEKTGADVFSAPQEFSSTPMEKSSTPMEKSSTPMEKSSTPTEKTSTPTEKTSTPTEKTSTNNNNYNNKYNNNYKNNNNYPKRNGFGEIVTERSYNLEELMVID